MYNLRKLLYQLVDPECSIMADAIAISTNIASAEDYEYDVFFSYKRDELTLDWNRNVVERIKFWLSEELGGSKVRMFVDERSIPLGASWPDDIKHAIVHSRCIICVWCPSYFQSGWCLSEWKSFVEREKVTGATLIAPLKFHDGDHFPVEARKTQWKDVATYAVTVPVFWSTSRAVELEEILKDFAHSVAELIVSAPGFRPDWPIIEEDGIVTPTIRLARL